LLIGCTSLPRVITSVSLHPDGCGLRRGTLDGPGGDRRSYPRTGDLPARFARSSSRGDADFADRILPPCASNLTVRTRRRIEAEMNPRAMVEPKHGQSGQELPPPAPVEAWHTLAVDVSARHLRTDGTRGLTNDEAARRLERFGANRLEQSPGRTPFAILLNQFKSLLVLLLFAAA